MYLLRFIARLFLLSVPAANLDKRLAVAKIFQRKRGLDGSLFTWEQCNIIVIEEDREDWLTIFSSLHHQFDAKGESLPRILQCYHQISLISLSDESVVLQQWHARELGQL